MAGVKWLYVKDSTKQSDLSNSFYSNSVFVLVFIIMQKSHSFNIFHTKTKLHVYTHPLKKEGVFSYDKIAHKDSR